MATAVSLRHVIRFIGPCSGAALLFLSSLSPSLAAIHIPEKEQYTVELAGFGDFIDVIRDGQDIYEDHQENVREQEIHEAQMEERERRLRAYEEAQTAAAEATRQEASRRQQLWESMTPQQRHSYMEEQRQAQARQDEAANLFMLGLGSALIEGMMTPDCRLYEGDYGNVYEVCN